MATDTTELRVCIEEYLSRQGLPLRKPFRCLSPEHADIHPSMRYNERAQNVHCFSCGVTYDIFDLVGMEYDISDFMQRVDKVRGLFGFDSVLKKKNGVGTDYDGQLREMRRNADESIDYFVGRGISRESCERYGFFQFRGRAYFPVMEGSVCVGWCGRAIEEDLAPRYKNSPGPLGIWNGDRLQQAGCGRYLFVTEGIIDAVCLEQIGECAIALCGSQNTGKLLRRCEESPQKAEGWRFILCGDPDEAGQKMNVALRERLTHLGIECAVLPLQSVDGDVAALYQRDPDRLRQLIGELLVELPKYSIPTAADSIDEFFQAAQARAIISVPSTGFPSLDKLLDSGLHAGLYILGAISSLGKTSLALQIADYVAQHSSEVLFFSLEQSRFELLAKSLSRTSALLDSTDGRLAFTARQLLSGQAPGSSIGRQLLQDTKATYTRAATGLFIREGAADIGVAEIRAAVIEHRAKRGVAPVVFIDYLQILKPADPRATDKQNTDRAVVELKRISRDFDIPVIAISSFNRENYRAAVSMEAFKESGAVEYSSDVLLGMQLQGAGGKEFDVNAEKVRDPRRIELVLLKNRNGVPYAKMPLRYYAKYSLFREGRAGGPANPSRQGGIR